MLNYIRAVLAIILIEGLHMWNAVGPIVKMSSQFVIFVLTVWFMILQIKNMRLKNKYLKNRKYYTDETK